MIQYIPKSEVVAEIERLKADALQKKSQCKRSGLERIMHQIGAYNKILSFLNTLEVKEEQPEPYFYCKYGGTMPLCSDCKRNHNNSSFKTEEITTWYAPSNGTKHCIDYIQQEQSKVDLEEEIDKELDEEWYGEYISHEKFKKSAKHFFELGLKAQKGE